jgi:ABC-type lipoprotein export system ATPase subunit
MIENLKEKEKKFLECEDIVKIYSEGAVSVPALRGVSYTFESGKIYVIFGPSGSGKTTLLSILGGLLTPSAGLVNYNDEVKITKESKDLFDYRIQNVSFIFQEPIFVPFLNTIENLKFVNRNYSKEELEEKIGEILIRTGLDHRKNSYPYQLSGGEKQRLSISLALLLNCNLWLCDEPTGTLDTENKKNILKLLKEIVSTDRSKIMINVTHDPIFQEIADKILILKDGIIQTEIDKGEFDDFSEDNIMYKSFSEDLEKKVRSKNIRNLLNKLKDELDKE